MAAPSKFKLHLIYLSLGSNDGDRLLYLRNALRRIGLLGIDLKVSPLVESDAWGYDDAAKYLNLVCSLYTILGPDALLLELQSIERELGRVRTKPSYEARTIDIDILMFDDEVIDSDTMTIPHPRLSLRNFVLIPFAQLAPDTMHPLLLKTIAQLLSESSDQTPTSPYDGIEL